MFFNCPRSLDPKLIQVINQNVTYQYIILKLVRHGVPYLNITEVTNLILKTFHQMFPRSSPMMHMLIIHCLLVGILHLYIRG